MDHLRSVLNGMTQIDTILDECKGWNDSLRSDIQVRNLAYHLAFEVRPIPAVMLASKFIGLQENVMTLEELAGITGLSCDVIQAQEAEDLRKISYDVTPFYKMMMQCNTL